VVTGVFNPNVFVPINKLTILPLSSMDVPNIFSGVTVLFNPQTYRMSRQTIPAQDGGKGGGRGRRGKQQFAKSACAVETLEMDLFLDTFSAGLEVTDFTEPLRGALFAVNSALPGPTKFLDVRDYVDEIYKFAQPDKDLHRPPALCLKWSSLKFTCFMQSCSVEYVKFNELGTPVRAVMHCVFVEALGLAKVFNSPDTSKFHTLKQGETLNTLAGIAYDDLREWRLIAEENDIVNPRLLRSGDMLHMPAKVD